MMDYIRMVRDELLSIQSDSFIHFDVFISNFLCLSYHNLL